MSESDKDKIRTVYVDDIGSKICQGIKVTYGGTVIDEYQYCQKCQKLHQLPLHH